MVPIVPPEHSERGLDSGTRKRKYDRELWKQEKSFSKTKYVTNESVSGAREQAQLGKGGTVKGTEHPSTVEEEGGGGLSSTPFRSHF